MRYILAFFATILLIFLLVVLVFGGGKSKSTTGGKTLASYATTGSEVKLTIDGPINVAQNHRQVQITVDNNDVNFKVIQGYDGNVINNQDFAGSQNAYTNFLYALEHAGFTDYNTDPALANEQGYCSLADRYVFELSQGGNDVERAWATGCGNPKNYHGNLNLTLQLFEAQVPNYGPLTANLSL
jgi:hypothetical protein